MLQLQGPMEMFTGPKLASEITVVVALLPVVVLFAHLRG